MAGESGGSATAPAVGLLCGGGALPRTVAEALRSRGTRVVAVCIEGEADPALRGCVDEIHWASLAQLGRWIRTFKKAGVPTILMVGGIRKRRMFQNKAVMLPDWRTVKFWYAQLKSREDHTILGGVAGEFELDGIRVGSVVDYCPELLIGPGCLTRRRPSTPDPSRRVNQPRRRHNPTPSRSTWPPGRCRS